MGPGPEGSTDAACVVAGGSPEPRSVEPLAAVGLDETSRQRGVLALGLVVGALGKPYACAQAVVRCAQAGSLAYFARVCGSLAAGFFSASRFEIFLRKFFGISAARRFACEYARHCFRACLLVVLSQLLQFYFVFAF